MGESEVSDEMYGPIDKPIRRPSPESIEKMRELAREALAMDEYRKPMTAPTERELFLEAHQDAHPYYNENKYRVLDGCFEDLELEHEYWGWCLAKGIAPEGQP